MKEKERGIQARVLMVALAPVIVTAVALTLYFTLLRYNDVETELRQRGFAMTRQSAASAQYGLFSGNTADLNRLARALAREPDVSAITIYDQRGAPLVVIGTPLASPLPSSLMDGWSGNGKGAKSLSFHNKVFSSSLPSDGAYSEKSSASAPAPLLLGSITIELSRENLVARKREILLFTVGAAVLILLAAGLIARRLGRDISEPILALENTVSKIRQGLLDARVHPHSAGTLRSLEAGINAMATALEQAQMRSMEALNSSNRQLQQQSDFANALLDAQSEAGICLMVTDNGLITLANQAALKFADLAADDLVNMPVSQIAAPRSKDDFERQYLRVFRGEVPYSRVEVEIAPVDDALRWAEIVIFGIHRDNRRMVVLLCIDITQRKRDAHQLLKAHEQLQMRKEEAERASAAKSRFLAAASHDLRQPLHALTLFAGQLRGQITTPAQSLVAGQIDAAIGSMSELLESLLDISKIDLATTRPDTRTIELGQLFEQITISHRYAAESKRLKLSVAQTSLWVSSDPLLLFRIVSNLVSNAVRYTERGSVLVGARRVGDMIRIEVWDTGIGIEEKHLSSLFQEFYQVANPERDAGKGLGLGLAIVDRLANLLGHKVSVRSTPGAGSVFIVLVPRAVPEHTESKALLSEKPDTRIVLASGGKAQQNDLAQLLAHWGYAVTICHESKLKETVDDAAPDLVICERTCIDCAERGRRIPSTTPVICIMEEAEMASIRAARHFCSRLSAPVKPAKLRALILHLLAQKEARPKAGFSVS